MDKKINSLRPGQTLSLGVATWVERSGNGQTLRFVRQVGNAQIVFKTCKF